MSLTALAVPITLCDGSDRSYVISVLTYVATVGSGCGTSQAMRFTLGTACCRLYDIPVFEKCDLCGPMVHKPQNAFSENIQPWITECPKCSQNARMKLWLHKMPAEVHRICQNVEHVDIRTLRCFMEQITSTRRPRRCSRHAIA